MGPAGTRDRPAGFLHTAARMQDAPRDTSTGYSLYAPFDHHGQEGRFAFSMPAIPNGSHVSLGLFAVHRGEVRRDRGVASACARALQRAVGDTADP